MQCTKICTCRPILEYGNTPYVVGIVWIKWSPHNQRWRKVVEIGGGTSDGVCISMHILRGSGGMLPKKVFLKVFFLSEIAPQATFVLKFIFGLDAARKPGLGVFEALLAMLHGSRWR